MSPNSGNWANKVNNLMDQFAIDLGDNVTSYKQYSVSNQPADPTNLTEPPVYALHGASGTVTADPFYQSSIPVYANAGLGHQHMFARVLKQKDQGDDVATLQQALSITPDGMFGTQTTQAVTNYQQTHGLTSTPGNVDFAMWNTLNLSQPETTVSAGQSIAIDGIVQGMAGGIVTEWYHVPSLNGWINSADVTLNNVYQITAPGAPTATDAEVPVFNTSGQKIATIHVGDDVVSTDQIVGGKTAIRFSNLLSSLSSVPQTGYIRSSDATLTQVAH